MKMGKKQTLKMIQWMMVLMTTQKTPFVCRESLQRLPKFKAAAAAAARAEQSDATGNDTAPSADSKCAANMRELYWKVVHEAQARIKKASPDLSGREVVKMARQECYGSI